MKQHKLVNYNFGLQIKCYVAIINSFVTHFSLSLQPCFLKSGAVFTQIRKLVYKPSISRPRPEPVSPPRAKCLSDDGFPVGHHCTSRSTWLPHGAQPLCFTGFIETPPCLGPIGGEEVTVCQGLGGEKLL